VSENNDKLFEDEEPIDLDTLESYLLSLADNAELELDLRDCGFMDEEEFSAYEGRFGNLMVLESELNKTASNKPPTVKAQEEYQDSQIRAIRLLGNRIVENNGFKKDSIENRTNEIVETIKEEWAIPE